MKTIARLVTVLAIAAVLLLLMHYYGSWLNVYLLFVLLASLVFFLYSNNEIDRRVFSPEFRRKVEELYRRRKQSFRPDDITARVNAIAGAKFKKASFLLLTLVFLFSVFITGYMMMPRGQDPYYNNMDCTGLMNKGVSFRGQLPLFTAAPGRQSDGLFPASDGSVTVKESGKDRWVISSNSFYEPLLKWSGDQDSYELINKIYRRPIGPGAVISGRGCRLELLSLDRRRRFSLTGPGRSSYHIRIRAVLDGVAATPYTDTLLLEHYTLNKGKDLYRMLCRDAACRPETSPLLETLSEALGSCYLIADKSSGSPSLYFFPSADFARNGFSLRYDGHVMPMQLTASDTIAAKEKFFAGLFNSQNTWYLDTLSLNGAASSALLFNRPRFYPMSAAAEGAPLGQRQVRFLCNHYEDILGSGNREGFLFSDDLRPAGSNRIAGILSYDLGRPGQAPAFFLQDNIAGVGQQVRAGGGFSLAAENRKYNWLYEVRDFSVNKYGLAHTIAYLSALYLLMLVILLYQPSATLQKLEATLYALLLAFLTLRYLLLWRVATFPPLENITNNELNLLTNYDNQLGSWNIGISGTFLFCGLFLLLVLAVRIAAGKGMAAHFAARYRQSFPVRYPLLAHTLSLAAMGLLLLSPNDLLTRLAGILAPVLLFLFFSAVVVRRGARYERPGAGRRWLRPLYQLRETPVFYLTLITFLFLSLSDRGFAVLFLLFVIFKNVLYNFVRQRSVPVKPADRKPVVRVNYWLYGTLAFGVYIAFIGWKPLFFHLLTYKVIVLQVSLAAAALLAYITHYHKVHAISRKGLTIFLAAALVAYGAAAIQWYERLPLWAWIAIPAGIAGVLFLVFAPGMKQEGSKLLIGNYGSRLKRAVYVCCIGGVAALCIPRVSAAVDAGLSGQIRHVIYRAAIIYQPLEDLVYKSSYQSFEERKIIETAESQWFINRYLAQPYDNSRRINLRPHFARGVDYTTQTRDIILPRFVISELGNVTMILMLGLLALPLIIYFSSYRLADVTSAQKPFIPASYAPGLALILFFTLGFFVWLTSTNRFVFFGQDFPFISLTSKLSVLLPLALFFVVLVSDPARLDSLRTNIAKRLRLNALLIVLLLVFILISGSSNKLKDPVFNTRLDRTARLLEQEIDPVFQHIQDSLHIDQSELNGIDVRNPVATKKLRAAIAALAGSERFKDCFEKADVYSQSLLRLVTTNPVYALRRESPVYLKFDQGSYHLVYNRNLHLEPPPYDNKLAWKGDLYQEERSADSGVYPMLTLGGATVPLAHLPALVHSRNGSVGVAVIPTRWLSDRYLKAHRYPAGVIGLISGYNTNEGNNRRLQIQLPAHEQGVNTRHIADYAGVIGFNDIAYVFEGNGAYPVTLSDPGRFKFMANYWVNGRQRMMYPMGNSFFWPYRYAHVLRQTFESTDSLYKNAFITLDYKLCRQTGNYLNEYLPRDTASRPRGFKFAVIAADGDGKIRVMADFAKNRKLLNPNNEGAIARLEDQHFFFSDTRNEIDQWGNTNLVKFRYGPGSSIKPLIAAAVAAEINAGWSGLGLAGGGMPATPAGQDKNGLPLYAATEYAGYALPQGKAWSEEHYGENSPTNMVRYISSSSNLYHSLVLFLGSYPAAGFKRNGQPSLDNVLVPGPSGNNHFPRLTLNGQERYLPPLQQGGWPGSGSGTATYFGNPHSVLAEGLATKLGLLTGDVDKTDYTLLSYARKNFAGPAFDSLVNKGTGAFLWAFPEQSFFPQPYRTARKMSDNFSFGLKIPTSGGYPYMLTPLKMAEMYGKLFSQNLNYQLHIAGPEAPYLPWTVDSASGWPSAAAYQAFLRANIFEGMKRVFTEGTKKDLFQRQAVYGGYYLYGKTGTISEKGRGGANSKLLAVVLSKNDLCDPATDFRSNRFYVVYFTAEDAKDHPDEVIRHVLDELIRSESFKTYMNR